MERVSHISSADVRISDGKEIPSHQSPRCFCKSNFKENMPFSQKIPGGRSILNKFTHSTSSNSEDDTSFATTASLGVDEKKDVSSCTVREYRSKKMLSSSSWSSDFGIDLQLRMSSEDSTHSAKEADAKIEFVAEEVKKGDGYIVRAELDSNPTETLQTSTRIMPSSECTSDFGFEVVLQLLVKGKGIGIERDNHSFATSKQVFDDNLQVPPKDRSLQRNSETTLLAETNDSDRSSSKDPDAISSGHNFQPRWCFPDSSRDEKTEPGFISAAPDSSVPNSSVLISKKIANTKIRGLPTGILDCLENYNNSSKMAQTSYNVRYGNLEPGAVQVLEKYFPRQLQVCELNSDCNHRGYQPAPPKDLRSNPTSYNEQDSCKTLHESYYEVHEETAATFSTLEFLSEYDRGCVLNSNLYGCLSTPCDSKYDINDGKRKANHTQRRLQHGFINELSTDHSGEERQKRNQHQLCKMENKNFTDTREVQQINKFSTSFSQASESISMQRENKSKALEKRSSPRYESLYKLSRKRQEEGKQRRRRASHRVPLQDN